MEIDTIILDLGGVLFDIAHEQTRSALSELSTAYKEIDFSLKSQDDVFSKYDSGLISSDEFRSRLRVLYQIKASDKEIDTAWNTMLLGLFPESLGIVQSLKKRYRVALLSNINEIHFQKIEEECLPLYLELHDCFFSYKLGCRKPDSKIYRYAIEAMNIKPENALFFDDTPKNLVAAQEFGIKTCLISRHNPLSTALHSLTIL